MRFHLFPPKYRFTPVFERFVKDKVAPGRRILDLASKDFRMAHYFSGLTYIGADIDAGAVAAGKTKYPDGRSIGICCDILSLPFVAEAFDYVISTHTLIHVAGNPGKIKAVGELIRVTAKDGHLFFNVPLDEGLEDQLDVLLQGHTRAVHKIRYRRTLCGIYETTMSRYAHHSNNLLVKYAGHIGSLLAHALDRYGPYSYAIYICQFGTEYIQ